MIPTVSSGHALLIQMRSKLEMRELSLYLYIKTGISHNIRLPVFFNPKCDQMCRALTILVSIEHHPMRYSKCT